MAGKFLQDRTPAAYPVPFSTHIPLLCYSNTGLWVPLLSHSSLPFQTLFPIPSSLSESNLSASRTRNLHPDSIPFSFLPYNAKNSCIQPLNTLKHSCPSLKTNAFAGKFWVFPQCLVLEYPVYRIKTICNNSICGYDTNICDACTRILMIGAREMA